MMALHTSWRLFAWVGAAVLSLGCIGLLLMALTDNALGLLEDPTDDAGTYFAVFALVWATPLSPFSPVRRRSMRLPCSPATEN